ncbi:hypothetical protein [Parahaliea mediterranea]|uniref:Sulfotransferase family protein n=1 Tax=Parahaliea mediterranea TaxID=651086 RepID=A0A939DC36_9GAMM|nr:hypothetical protein [Parahaliea mediterranea]MBN7795176.1 hypothetical protein [Parahaliea mediterranea]
MRHILLHAHIFKNAGTTLDWALQRYFGDGFLDHRDEESMREQGVAWLRQLVEQGPGLRAISSHHMPATAQAPGCAFHALYLLRHPLRRALSVYAFERRQDAQSRGARAAKEMDLQSYLAWRMRPDVPNVVRNYQTAYLAGCHRPMIGEQEMAELFGRALAALNAAPLVGLVERFDESMVLFEALLESRYPGLDLAYKPQNRTPGHEGGDLARVFSTLGDMAPDLVAENSYDLALYRLAQAKFNRAIAAIPGFEGRLREFRIRCNVIQQE